MAVLGRSLGQRWRANSSLALSLLAAEVLLSLLFLRHVAAFAVGKPPCGRPGGGDGAEECWVSLHAPAAPLHSVFHPCKAEMPPL